jgi:16S rRNA (adenine1518-N6/adenine1519-N6)-dimethyltransferase
MKEHIARKRFGQNFLVDRGIIGAIVSAINPARTDTVVEIGPGLGAITEPLLQRVDHLHVVEIDRDLIARLRKQHAPERMSIHEGDALAFDFSSIGRDLRLVGNLPYNISTPAALSSGRLRPAGARHAFHAAEGSGRAHGLCPGDADFGRLSVMLQYSFIWNG